MVTYISLALIIISSILLGYIVGIDRPSWQKYLWVIQLGFMIGVNCAIVKSLI